ncbi:Ycf53-like protein [Acaryochloris thomasi RCC1774]|uniref:Ycf53-like protein n=1 Tax=Acaryochloris thomasi RCC1774 TaxID=1764569 RepID=A0A2W1J992_9CYAN|nr:GUN4 domain-containing protein [Acaryochloris thomasi]PZD70658.1 Ycf53-like protein [Acaryochloris thomasi RCC1774]
MNWPYRHGLSFILLLSLGIWGCNRYEPEYQQLEKHLASGNWRQADQLTKQLFYKVGPRRSGGFLSPNGYLSRVKFESFPCKDLNRIEQMWATHSQGRFGFTVQKRLYVETGNTIDGTFDYKSYRTFRERVGWMKDGKILLYHQLSFEDSSPVGHLPAMNTNEAGIREPLFMRLEVCRAIVD